MEEEPTPHVITRLRRRLSTDTEGSISPATPTKKKSGKLAVKPQLENIDELATIGPRRSTRSIARETAEMIDEPLTPSRRSSRTKSVTSNITFQCCESPRAKRAARRNSHTGSDNEVPITPRSTRTRKNSNSSLDSQGEIGLNKIARVDIIKEELNDQKLKELNKEHKDFVDINNSSPIVRRSPRLNAKKNMENINLSNNSIEDTKLSENIENEKKGNHLNIKAELCSKTETKIQNVVIDQGNDAKENICMSKNTSFCDSVLVSDIDNKPNIKNTSQKNKSLSVSEDIKTKNRNRSKSFSDFAKNALETENIFFSDNEKRKENIEHTSQKNKSHSFSEDTKTKNRNRSKSFSNFSKNALETENVFFSDNEKHRKSIPKIHEKLLGYDDFAQKFKKSHKKECESDERNLSLHTRNHSERKENSIDFSVNSKTTAFVEDFDSDCLHRIKKNSKRSSVIEADDQCVPVVDQHLDNDDKKVSNLNSSNKNILVSIEEKKTSNDCEPMDIDETISENVTLIANQTKGTEISNMSEQKKSLSKLNYSNSSNNSAKSLKLLTEVTVDLFDIQANKYIALSKNSNVITKSSSSGFPDSKWNKTGKQKRDNTLVADTPSKQMQIQQLGIKTSTPVNITSSSQVYKQDNEYPKITSKSKNTSEMADTSHEASDRNNFLDDEALDAGLDYQSGDSQDEEERCYEDEHEILEKGITLTSHSDMSDDSDYEKDSFVVSSDEHDYELLSGSGDDLAQSDNELTMTIKSKSKYNKRKAKETKLASREMFQARHNIKIDSSVENMKKENKKKILKLQYSDSSDESDSKQLQINSITNEHQELNTNLESTHFINKENEIDSETLIDDNNTIISEKEITMDYNINETLNTDPLSNSLVIKEEVKSESFSRDIGLPSTNSTTLENIAEVDVKQDISMLETDATKHPLDKSDNDSDSSISENESLVKSYENMLNNLNEVHPTQLLTMAKSPLKTSMNKPEKLIEDETKVDNEANNTMTSTKKGAKKTSITIDSPKTTQDDSIKRSNKKNKKKLSVDNVNVDSTDTNTIVSQYCFDLSKKNLETCSANLDKTESSGNNNSDIKEKCVKKKKKHSVDNMENRMSEINAIYASDRFPDVTAEENILISANETDTMEKNVKKRKKYSIDNVETMAEVSAINVIDSNTSSNMTTKENISSSVKETGSSEDNYVNITEKSMQKKRKKQSTKKVENITAEDNAINISTLNRSSDMIAKANTSNNVTETESSKNNHIVTTEKNAKKNKKKHSGDNINYIVSEVNAINVLASNMSSDVTVNASNRIKETESSEDNYIDTKEKCVKKKKKKYSPNNNESIMAEANDINVVFSNKSFNVTAKENTSSTSVKETESSIDNYIDTTQKRKKKKKKRRSVDNVENTVAETNVISVLASNKFSDVTEKENTSNNINKTESSEDHGPCIDKFRKDKKKKRKQLENTENEDTGVKSILNAEKGIDSNRGGTKSFEDYLPSTSTSMKSTKKKKKNANIDSENIEMEEKLTTANIGIPVPNEILTKVPSDDHSRQFSNEQCQRKNKKKRDNTYNLPTLAIQQSISHEDSVPELEDLYKSKRHKRKHSVSENLKDAIEFDDVTAINKELDLGSKKRKKMFSDSSTPSHNEADGFKTMEKHEGNPVLSTNNPKKKQKKSKDLLLNPTSLMQIEKVSKDTHENKSSHQKVNKRFNKLQTTEDFQEDAGHKEEDIISNAYFKKPKQFTEITENATNSEHGTKRAKKRKMRDEDGITNVKCVKKSENVCHVNVPRLPATVLQQLEGKPISKKSKISKITRRHIAISTTSFHVEKAKTFKAKPSQYPEQSVQIESPPPEPKKKKPKLINIVPAPSSSACGFTTTFKVNVVPKETQFVAQSSNITNFKHDHLYKKNIRRQGTYELYKKQRKIKLSKF